MHRPISVGDIVRIIKICDRVSPNTAKWYRDNQAIGKLVSIVQIDENNEEYPYVTDLDIAPHEADAMSYVRVFGPHEIEPFYESD